MAEDEGQERTEEPTEQRLRRALEDGQVLTSRDLLLAVVMLGGALQLSIGGRYYFGEVLGGFRNGLQISDALASGVPLLSIVGERLFAMLMPILLFSAPLVALLLIAQIALGGFHFLPQNALFKASRISPASGLSRMFGPSSLIELAKALLKIGLVGAVGVAYLRTRIPEIMALGTLPFETALVDAGSIVTTTFLVLVAGAAVIAALDVLIQWNKHHSQLMMTKQEIRDESKESDGSPEVKARIRRLQREAADRGSVANIGDAQVVITNPTHFAVALAYDFKQGSAPKVVAKGTDAVAKLIREQSKEKRIPALEYPLLARALYYTTEIGSEIHTELYRAVAAVLSYVLHAGLEGDKPVVEVPSALHFDTNGRTMDKRNG